MSLEPRCRHGNIRSAEPCRDCDERDALRARIDDLSRAYAGAGLAIEELTDERDRYREALKNLRDNIRITSSTVCPNPYLESWLVVIAEALKELTK